MTITRAARRNSKLEPQRSTRTRHSRTSHKYHPPTRTVNAIPVQQIKPVKPQKQPRTYAAEGNPQASKAAIEEEQQARKPATTKAPTTPERTTFYSVEARIPTATQNHSRMQ